MSRDENGLFRKPVYYNQDGCEAGVHQSEGRGQNKQPTPNDNKSEWWSSSAVLIYDLHRGMLQAFR